METAIGKGVLNQHVSGAAIGVVLGLSGLDRRSISGNQPVNRRNSAESAVFVASESSFPMELAPRKERCVLARPDRPSSGVWFLAIERVCAELTRQRGHPDVTSALCPPESPGSRCMVSPEPPSFFLCASFYLYLSISFQYGSVTCRKAITTRQW